LPDPDGISLSDSTKNDLFIVQVNKNCVFNDQQGTSLVFDASDFDEEDGTAFYVSVALEP
jgi:hypothetical protein